ncbi:MAG: cobyrinic acid a,c-diamide synthase, partial [Cenarchaeum sp. SB0663_bin_5]|nr:cobyrinic acid a,c-diamide synthase [Cenarchaeum sp. SB0663_bin_5]
ALDGSFNFYYKDNLEKLKNNGAKLEIFSPEISKHMPDINGLYIGGGFPEVRGAILEKNYTLINEIKKAILNEMPTYAECGGLIYLGKTLQYDNKQYDMVGAVDGHTYMTKRPTLNYTKGVMYDNILNKKTIKFHGHEFHYSKMDVSEDSRFTQKLYRGEGILDNKDGILVHNTMASYGHLYFSEKMAKNVVECCAKFSRR